MSWVEVEKSEISLWIVVHMVPVRLYLNTEVSLSRKYNPLLINARKYLVALSVGYVC